jgi:hypothetical protein
MYVEAVGADGDDRLVENMRFHGRVTTPDGRTGDDRRIWTGDEVSVRVPRFGYYQIGSGGPVYLSYSAPNRTNRKGLDPRTITINGRGKSDLSARQINVLFNQCEFPGAFSRDLCVHNNNLLWKGVTVGTLVNGDVTILNKYEPVRELICEQLGKFLTVRQVTLAQQ